MLRRNGSPLRSRLLAPLLAGALLLPSAGAVMAEEPPIYTLDVFNCTVFDPEGNILDENVVPAGSALFAFQGWIANTRGQVQSFVNNTTWVLTVNGEPVDVTPDLSGVIDLGPFWGDLFFTPIGTLAAGESFDTHFDNVLKSASFDGVVHWAKGSVYDGGVDCTVSAAP